MSVLDRNTTDNGRCKTKALDHGISFGKSTLLMQQRAKKSVIP
jgi:hypothetical protein